MLGRFSRVAIAALILWLLWGERIFWPAHRDLPADTALVSSRDELRALAIGQSIAIEGRVFPAQAAASESLWKERFAYRRAISQKNEFGGLEEVVTHHLRPAIRFEWAGGEIAVPADSYQMGSAPEAPDDSLLHTTERNVGFRIGDAALALGRKTGDAAVAVDALAVAPLEAYLKTLQRENVFRAWISHGLRVIVTLFALSLIVGAFKPQEARPLASS